MKKHNVLLGTIGIISLLMYGCASPDQEIIGEKPDKQNVTSGFNEENGNNSMEVGSNGSLEDGRHISAVYGSGDYILKIDADVVIPETELMAGTLVPKEPDISLIEEYLCGGSELHKNADGTSYISDSNEAGTDLGSDYIVHIGDGSINFSNYKLDSYFTGFPAQQIPPLQQNEDQKAFVADMENKTQELFDQLNIEGQISHSWLKVGDTDSYCGVFVNAYLEGVPLVSRDSGNFVQSNVTISGHGINGANIYGLYEIGESQPASILPLHEVLSIIERDIENKYINNYENVVESITLAYMLEQTDGLSFFPVWCFSGVISEESGSMPFLCINAQTGNVELMSGF